MCNLETSWTEESGYLKEVPDVLVSLKEMEADGLIEIGTNSVKIRESGRHYVRNVYLAFDVLLQRHQPETQLFSMTIFIFLKSVREVPHIIDHLQA